MIEIVKWSESFESSDTRKRQRLGWFLSPSGCDSKGFRKLMRMGKDGLIALGFFQSLCQSMATQSIAARRSGVFMNSDETLMDLDDILELSRLSGMEVADYRQIIGRLVSVGWISLHNSLESQQSATCLPPVCHLSPGFVQGEGEGQGKEQGEVPPNPQGGRRGSPVDNLPTSPQALRISALYHRKPTTKWADKEIKAFKAIPCEAIEHLELVCRYTESERLKGDKGWHKRDLKTFLNQFQTELDRARAWEMNPNGAAVKNKTTSVADIGMSS